MHIYILRVYNKRHLSSAAQFFLKNKPTMGDPAVYWVVAIHLLATTFISPQIVNSQIPRVCADAESLQSMKCCPDECGGTERGMCVTLSSEGVPDRVSDDVRSNWPHYYNQTCRCNGNYAGYDCSRCKFGYFGEDCSNKRVFPRRNILSLSDSEFDEYITILKMTTTTDSGYVAIMNESVPGSTNINRADLTLYEMFVWVHQFAAKDTACTGEQYLLDLHASDYYFASNIIPILSFIAQ